MFERTLVLLKPECIERKLIGKIIERIENANLNIQQIKILTTNKKIISEHYPEDQAWLKLLGEKTRAAPGGDEKWKDWTDIKIGYNIRNKLINSLVDKPVVAMVVSGEFAIQNVRKLIGATEPRVALAGTIRGDFSTDSYDLADKENRSIENLIHASDSQETAEREIKLYFNSK